MSWETREIVTWVIVVVMFLFAFIGIIAPSIKDVGEWINSVMDEKKEDDANNKLNK